MFVYPPSEDSFLLLKWAKKFCKGKKVLEIGCGSGVISEEIKKIAKDLLATDINPKAVEICISKGIKAILSDLFEKVRGKFDIILFNPPYLPEEEEKDVWIRRAIYGGRKGNEVIIRFLEEAWKHLKKDGVILLIWSSRSNPEEIIERFKEIYEFDILESLNLFFERISCVKVRRIEDHNNR